MPHGYPGTPVGDLFPLGQSAQGSGGGLSLRARTDPNEQVMSPNGRTYPPARESRGRTPPRAYGGNLPNRPQEFFGASINMIGQFLQVRRGDEEAVAARISYELNEHTASTVREAQLQQEYQEATAQLQAELSAAATQQLQYAELEHRLYAEARLRTAETALGSEYSQSQAAMQGQYLQQVQEVNSELLASQRRFEEAIHRESSAHAEEVDKLRRELC